MSYDFLEIVFTKIAYLVTGLVSASLAGTISFLIWMSLTRVASKFCIKYSVVLLRITMLSFILPLLFFGVLQVWRIPDGGHRRIFLIAPVAKYIMLVSVLWIFVMLCITLYRILQSRSKRYLCIANKPVLDENIIAIAEKWKDRLNIRQKTTLFYNELVASPMLIYNKGYQILLPVYPIEEEQMNIVLLHELVHLKHGDILLKKCMLIINALHAINPFSYWSRKQMTQWMEADCDHTCCEVGKDEFDRREYFSCILALKEESIEKAWKDTACSLFDGCNTLQFRFNMLKQMKGEGLLSLQKKAAVMMVCSVLVFVLSSGTVSYGLNCWVESAAAAEKVSNSDEASFGEATQEGIFDGAKKIELDESAIGSMESTDFTIKPGEIYVCNVPQESDGVIVSMITCESGMYQFGYVTDQGRVKCTDHSGDMVVRISGDEAVIEQIFIKNNGNDDIPVEWIVHRN